MVVPVTIAPPPKQAVFDFQEEEIEEMLAHIDQFTPEEQAEILKIMDVLALRKQAAACHNDLIEFCKHMQPDYIVGRHHRHLASMLMDIADGKKDRVCVNMPPRHGKSQLVSIYFPAWFIGRYPNKKILMVSHTTDLAVDFGRKVRNIIDSDAYRQIFPTVALAADSKSAGRWNTNMGGEFYACGIGSALAGRGADLLLVDDPHNEQDVLNGNFEIFERAYEWFTYGARTRLMPGGRISVVQCMVGDTPVLMSDGMEKPLRDVRPGEFVASFDAGKLTHQRVLGHKSNGIDSVYAITTTCGAVVRANERHPFLVTHNGELRWVRLKDLQAGDTLVSLRGARGPHGQKQNPACATTVILPSDTQKQPQLRLQWPNTCDFTETRIASIESVGEEEVFDVQVEHTESFIANGLVSHNTRWHMDDLTGRLTRDMGMNDQADQYEIVEFPAILDIEKEVTETDPETQKEVVKTVTVQKPLWPEFFDIPALLRTKASMPVFQWNAQYQQNPTAEEAALVKREWWNIWTKEDPPQCEYVISTLDAAAETNNRADFTAITTWGVWLNEEREGPGANAYNIILLNAIKKRVEFPELKEIALREYKDQNPDTFIVEKKSSGTALYQELRRIGVPVSEYTPHRGSGDKVARLNSVSDIVRSGLVWVPQTRWAEEVVEEIAGFPFAPNDDLVDATTMALMRFRQGGFISLPTDEPDDVVYFKSRRRGRFY